MIRSLLLAIFLGTAVNSFGEIHTLIGAGIIDVQLLVTRPYLNQGEVMVPDVSNDLDVLGIENRSHCPGGRIWWSRGESNP